MKICYWREEFEHANESQKSVRAFTAIHFHAEGFGILDVVLFS